MKLYSNVHDYVIYTRKIYIKSIMRINVYLDISLFAHFKRKGKYITTARIPKYMYDQNTYVFPLFFYAYSFMNIKSLETLLFLLEIF